MQVIKQPKTMKPKKTLKRRTQKQVNRLTDVLKSPDVIGSLVIIVERVRPAILGESKQTKALFHLSYDQLIPLTNVTSNVNMTQPDFEFCKELLNRNGFVGEGCKQILGN